MSLSDILGIFVGMIQRQRGRTWSFVAVRLIARW